MYIEWESLWLESSELKNNNLTAEIKALLNNHSLNYDEKTFLYNHLIEKRKNIYDVSREELDSLRSLIHSNSKINIITDKDMNKLKSYLFDSNKLDLKAKESNEKSEGEIYYSLRKESKNMLRIDVETIQRLIWTHDYGDFWPKSFLKYKDKNYNWAIESLWEFLKRNNKIKSDKKNLSIYLDENISELDDEARESLFKILEESEWIKKDCYNFVYSVSKNLSWDFPIFRDFLKYNKNYNSKNSWYRWSMTQFLKLEWATKISFDDFHETIKWSKDGSVFLVSMNSKYQKWFPNYEHTWFVTHENWELFLTHWETYAKWWAQWSVKAEIKKDWGYFSSTGIRKRFNPNFQNFLQKWKKLWKYIFSEFFWLVYVFLN